MRNTVERPIGFRQSSCMLRGHEQCNDMEVQCPLVGSQIIAAPLHGITIFSWQSVAVTGMDGMTIINPGPGTRH